MEIEELFARDTFEVVRTPVGGHTRVTMPSYEKRPDETVLIVANEGESIQAVMYGDLVSVPLAKYDAPIIRDNEEIPWDIAEKQYPEQYKAATEHVKRAVRERMEALLTCVTFPDLMEVPLSQIEGFFRERLREEPSAIIRSRGTAVLEHPRFIKINDGSKEEEGHTPLFLGVRGVPGVLVETSGKHRGLLLYSSQVVAATVVPG